MRFIPSLCSLPLLAVLSLGGVACAPVERLHGYVPIEEDIAAIRIGVDGYDSVEQVFGQPASGGLLGDSEWYYIQSRVQHFTYNPPRVIDRTVLAVSFDGRGIVSGINKYGLEDGRIVNLTTRTTQTGGRTLGVLEQLFGNLLNLDASQFN